MRCLARRPCQRLPVICAAIVCTVAGAAIPGVVGAVTLQEAVRAALSTNPSLKAQSQEVRAAAYDLVALERNYLPTITAFGEAGAIWVDDPGGLSPSDNDEIKGTAQVGLAAEVTLFDGYRRANETYDRAARVDGTIFQLLDASETMALNATEAYFDVVRHRMLLDAAQRNLSRHRDIASQVQSLVDGGRLPESSAFTVEDRLRAAELTILQIRQAARDADARYARVVGADPGGNMTIPRLRDMPPSQDALVASALRNSHRLKFAQSEIDRTVYDQQIAKGERLPRVTLNAGVTQGENRGGETGSESDAFVGLRLNWTFYSGGRRAEDAALVARNSQAYYARQAIMREVEELARRAWSSLETNTERAILVDRQLRTNQRLVRQYRSEFEAAARSLLDVLEAERALYNVEFQKISTDVSFAFSQYRVLATQSRLAAHFGIPAADITLDPTFQSRARAKPASVFATEIPPLE